MLIALIAVAALISATIVVRTSAAAAVLSIFLPVLMLWPSGYDFRFKGVDIAPLMAASLPIAIGALWRYGRYWKLSAMDLLVVLYPISACISQWRAEGQSGGLVELVANAWGIFPAYIIGKILIERASLRIAFLRRFTSLLLLVALISVYEYRMEANPFRIFAGKLTHMQTAWLVQIRWGAGRIAGPFGHAILAGILFFSGVTFALWLHAEGYLGRTAKQSLSRAARRSGYWKIAGLVAGIWMTQSRGPWMGGAFGLLLFYAGRAPRLKRSLRRAALLGLALFAIFAFNIAQYTDTSQTPQSQDQENAVYRRELVTNYIPVVQQGGLFGWGIFFPHIDGQVSIDDEFLSIALRQGYLGLGIFVLMVAQTGVSLVCSGLQCRLRQEASFRLCLLGVFTGMVFTLATVYLGTQVFPLFFLILGWAQSLTLSKAPAEASVALATSYSVAPRYAFRRVFN